MRGFFRFVFYDFKRKWGAPFTIAIFIALPVILALLMSTIFGNGKKVKFSPPKIALVNKDNGIVSKTIVRFLTDERMKKEFNFVLMDLQRARKKMLKDEFSAIVIIPKNFTSDFFDEKCPEILLIENPSQGIYPKMVETMLSLLSEGVNYFFTYYHSQFEEVASIHKDVKKGVFSIKLLFQANKLKKLGKDFLAKSKKLFYAVKSLPFEVRFTKEGKIEKEENFMITLFPPYALFFLLFFANICAVSIVEERRKAITNRILLTKMGLPHYLLGKISSSVLFLIILSIVFSVCGFLLFDLKTPNVLLFFLIIVFGCFSLFSVFFLTSSLAKSQSSASNLGMVLIFLMGFSGGGMIPLNLLPSSIVSFSKLFPFYSVNKMIAEILTSNSVSFQPMLYLILVSLLCYCAGFWGFKKFFREIG